MLTYQCSQRAAVRGLELADLACGLREPQQLKASELYKYYHMSRCHVGGRVGGIETFGLRCLAHKVPHKRPSVCLCHSQLPPTHSSAPISAFPAGTPVPPGVNLREWGWGGGESKPPAKCGSCSSAVLFLYCCCASLFIQQGFPQLRYWVSYLPDTVLGTGNPVMGTDKTPLS